MFVNAPRLMKSANIFFRKQFPIYGSYPPKFSLPIFPDTPKMHSAYALIVAYLPNFS